jgi:hypothetical protein
MGNLNNCAEISEMIYWATHPEEREEKIEEKQNQWIEYDVSPLIELALATKDEEWFNILTSGI